VSINAASYIAYSALMAVQTEMAVASGNIANAATAGYTEETANQASLVNAGAGAGVTVTGITSNIDQLLMKSLVSSASDVGSADSLNSFLNQLQELYGSTAGSSTAGTSLGNTLATFESAVSALQSNPGDASQEANTVQALGAVTAQLNQISSGIQTLRGNADQAIGTSVSDVNKQLQLIGSLNTQIAQATATGQPTGSLQDQRNSALQDVASQLNISYFTAPNGSLQIYTASGQALVDSTVHTISYTPAASVTASTTYSATPPSGFGGIMVNGQDITSQVGSGTLGALINLRDTILPGAQSQLDQLANQLSSSLNTVSNQGTPMPPPTSLTGTAVVTTTTPLNATGTMRIALVNQSGTLQSYQDIDLATSTPPITTVGGLVSAINNDTSTSGLSASINANGNLVISSTKSGDGVAINEMTSSVGSSGEGLSDWLGLNDLVTGSGAANIAVNSSLASNPGLLPTSTLASTASLTAGATVLTSGSQTVANDLYSALTGSTAFSAAGGLGATSTSLASYAADITAYVASQASQASTNDTNQQAAQSAFQSSMSSESGVNIDQETAQLSSLQNEYSAAAEVLQVVNQMFSALVSAVQST
jgi:flagellar hook-associated protein 1 FlgK